MGLLESMISQAIRRETGINPRRLIRKIGGGNLLMAGGAALAGKEVGECEGAEAHAAVAEEGTSVVGGEKIHGADRVLGGESVDENEFVGGEEDVGELLPGNGG